MPRPADPRHRYLPGLDGLRAIAVLAVIAYHLNFGWAQGGLVGVGVFFTLSGYLITDLLLERWDRTGTLQLRDFWLRRARRLLPALAVMLAVVTMWVALADHAQLAALGGDVLAAAVYASNWWFIAHHVSYFSQFGPRSPLGHLWSLAVEEQFYLAWPWLLLLGLRLLPGRKVWAGRRRQGLALVTLAGAAASALAMALLYHPTLDPTRVYDGTDTRAFGLLIGAALALAKPWRSDASGFGRRRGPLLDLAGLGGLAVVFVFVWGGSQYSPFLYRGGMVLLSVATALIVAAVAAPGGRLGILLGVRPLRWVGERSYGIYLWHYPVIVLTTPAGQHQVDLPRAALQVVASIALATLSWRYIEEPIRSGRVGRRNANFGLGAVYGHAARRWGWVAAACSLAGLVPLGALLAASPQPAAGGMLAAQPASQTVFTSSSPPSAGAADPAPAPGTAPRSRDLVHITTSGPPSTGGGSGAPAATPASPEPPATTSSCTSVTHIGDSTSESLVSPNYLPDPAQRLTAQYAKVGATTQHFEIYGGTSVVEHLQGEPNGYQIAQQLVSQGYRGCWVIALGTNDAADIAIGSHVGASARIQKMMSVIGNQPVMWVNATSLLPSGPYADSNMQAWDRALVQACASYPNMRVYDWAAAAQPGWFIADGIHYSSAGSAQRSQLIAGALAKAFPAPGQQGASGCVVH